jgi:NodT family efflux transporter outer membrane factor (OMF) lipoprotein
MKRAACVLIAFVTVVLTSCTVGPKYARPSVPSAPTDTFKEIDGWKTAHPSDQLQRGAWWEIFGDPQLNALENQLTVSNQDLKVAQARFQEARALVRFNRASLYPTISTAPGLAAIRDSGNQPYRPATHNSGDFVLPFDLSYELDVWGRVRRTVAASREEAQATAADLQTASLSLHAELAYDYFELRSADAQKQLLDDTVKAYQESLQLTTNRFEGGAAPKSDVAQAQTQLETTRVQDTDIAVQRAQFEHAIAILIGKPPAALSLPPSPLHVQPPDISAGLPSQLLERRPDIAAAERRVAEANEQIGIARAAFFPTIILSATAGFEGNSITNWFTWPSRFWAVGPSALEPLFDAGRPPRRRLPTTTQPWLVIARPHSLRFSRLKITFRRFVFSNKKPDNNRGRPLRRRNHCRSLPTVTSAAPILISRCSLHRLSPSRMSETTSTF